MELFDAVRAVVVLITPNPVTRIDRSVVSLQPPATPHVPVARRHVYKALEDFGLATAHGHGHRALILDLFFLQRLLLVELLPISIGRMKKEGRCRKHDSMFTIFSTFAPIEISLSSSHSRF